MKSKFVRVDEPIFQQLKMIKSATNAKRLSDVVEKLIDDRYSEIESLAERVNELEKDKQELINKLRASG